jgi:hypothetical protein
LTLFAVRGATAHASVRCAIADDVPGDAVVGGRPVNEEENLDAAVEQVRTRLKAYLREYLPRPWRPWR